MVFFALCAQCVSTLVTIKKETGHWGWAVFSFVYMTALAWVRRSRDRLDLRRWRRQVIANLIVVVVVNLAVIHIVRRVLRSLKGSCAGGCASGGGASKSCPAARGMAERLAQGVGTVPRD